MAQELKHDEWVGTTYGGSRMHRWLIKILRVTDPRIVYAFSNLFVVPVVMVAHSEARRHTTRFFRQRFGMGALRALWMTYRNHCQFSQVVIDRFAMYAGRRFKVEIEGYYNFLKLSKSPEAFVQLSSHIGNYELAGYTLVAEDKRFNAVVFANEKESVMKNRERMFARANIRMIPVKPDMSHLFTIDSAINDGEIISMPADRVFGSPKSFLLPFMGEEARFPQGAFMLAAAKHIPMLFVAVMKERFDRYRIHVTPLPAPQQATVRKQAEELARSFAALLEQTVKRYPTQWYNYYDFWAK